MGLSFEVFDRERELPQQRELFSLAFPENAGLPPETIEFYRRKFAEFPAEPPSHEFIARDEHGLGGYYAALPYTYNIDGELFRCGMVCDVMTAPRLRGQGVFTSLGHYSLSELERLGLDFVTGYPRRDAVIPGHLKVGWQVNFELPLYVLPLRSNALLRSKGLGFVAPLANAGLTTVNWARSAVHGSPTNLQVETLPWRTYLERFDHDALLKRWQTLHRNSLVKDSQYLRWRLSVQPVDYHIVTVQHHDELVGMSVVRQCDPEGVPSLGLLDVMCVGDVKRVTRAMLPAWRELARQLDAEVLLTMMSPHTARRHAMSSLGFLKSPVRFKLITKCLSERAKVRLDARQENWELMWIDCDDL